MNNKSYNRAWNNFLNATSRVLSETAEGIYRFLDQVLMALQAFKSKVGRFLFHHPMIKMFLVYFVLYCIVFLW